MTASGVIQIILYLALLLALAVPLGLYIARVYQGEARIAQKILGPVERLCYRAAGVDEKSEMGWKRYAAAVLIFNLIGIVVVYLLQRVQADLPANPNALANVDPRVAFNTAVSFASNTNWQSYGGETTMSHLTQFLGLAVQNFLSAATGVAVLVALIRGIARKQSDRIGNFWVDLTKVTLYVLIPLAVITALVLVSQGVVQTFDGHATATLLQPATNADGAAVTDQAFAVGPVASQIAIKQLGTNGGGWYNVNSAHPFENPTGLSNLIEMLAILLIPAALCFTFGRMIKSRAQGIALIAVMLAILVPLIFVTVAAEQGGNPALTELGVDQTASELQPGGNMEGKEARYGIANSGIWAVATTAASNGSVNAMHDSFTPLGGLGPMWLMQLGEVIFGGIGSGLYGLLMMAIVAVFIAGLMVGRTPEMMGKKIEAYEMKMASLAILIPPAAVLLGTAIACLVAETRSVVPNPGAHGFSEILYAFTSASNNNGSAFAGLTASGTFYATALGVCMLMGRYLLIVPVLAIAGSLARKKQIPPSAGTLSTTGPMFVFLLVATVLLVGALTFVPALALGPIVEHLQLFGR